MTTSLESPGMLRPHEYHGSASGGTPPATPRRPARTIVTDGFSCRTQTDQTVEGAEPLHLADVVWPALVGRENPEGRPPRRPFDP